MRIILSRKGVDSGEQAGHIPSPILNNTPISLPIPNSDSQITYADLSFRNVPFGTLVEDLSDGCLRRTRTAHLDPDLRRNTYPRKPGWRPIFGQGNPQARAHLQRRGVTVGDLFLFYGWFREAERHKGNYRYKSNAPDVHLVYGWLQVGEVVSCNDRRLSDIPWARYHDHFRWHDGTAYVASETLHLGYDLEGIAGAGHFTHYSDRLRLTAPGERRGIWQMPAWFRPRNRCFPLTYHEDRTRYSRRGDHTVVRSAARGQEFVLDSRDYPEAVAWARRLLLNGTNA